MCRCVAQEFAVLLGESHGASDRVVLDAREERRGREFFAPMR